MNKLFFFQLSLKESGAVNFISMSQYFIITALYKSIKKKKKQIPDLLAHDHLLILPGTIVKEQIQVVPLAQNQKS